MHAIRAQVGQRRLTEHGVDALRVHWQERSPRCCKGGVALANKDIEAIMPMLIEPEMKMFHGLSTPVELT